MESRLIALALAVILLAGAGYTAYKWSFKQGFESRNTEIAELTESNHNLSKQVEMVTARVETYKTTSEAVALDLNNSMVKHVALSKKYTKIQQALQAFVGTGNDPCTEAKQVAETYFHALKDNP